MAANSKRVAALIAQYVEAEPLEPSRARLAESGVPVWALIGYLRLAGGDVNRVAADYDLPHGAVEAALAYYRRHRDAIDARLRLNAPPSERETGAAASNT